MKTLYYKFSDVGGYGTGTKESPFYVRNDQVGKMQMIIYLDTIERIQGFRPRIKKHNFPIRRFMRSMNNFVRKNLRIWN